MSVLEAVESTRNHLGCPGQLLLKTWCCAAGINSWNGKAVGTSSALLKELRMQGQDALYGNVARKKKQTKTKQNNQLTVLLNEIQL